MGNSQTKESRPPVPRSRNQQSSPGASDAPGRSVYQSSRSGRGSSRPDLSLLGIGSSHHDREVATLEHRRETKQEREARRLEKERAARVKERERSMKEENVDGGYLVTQGVYVGTEDFDKGQVRQLMIERRLAPFWRGLNDVSESWAEHQLMAAARGMEIPPADEIPLELQYTPPKATAIKESADATNIQNLTVPITSRSQSFNSDVSHNSNPAQSLPSAASPIASGTSASRNLRHRAKTLSTVMSSKNSSRAETPPREIQLSKEMFVNGQPIEVYLYKDASECPICFLYYPPYLNRTRCCDQPICSECFVQIKRPDPHPPEHGEPDPNAPAPAEGTQEDQESQLVSEPSACPFCVQPEFGVTYAPPPFRRGLGYAVGPHSSARPSPNIASPVSSTSSLSSANIGVIPGRRRATSLSATDPSVVTTDRIRPDWFHKLTAARSHAARRSAAATALHTAAYLMNSSNESRGLSSLGRRGMRRATQGDTGRTSSPALNALAFLTERPDRNPPRAPETDSAEEGAGNIAPPRDSSRRTRIDDLEEMMMMEAIRLSLASEEERLRREEKEARKDAKKREKEAKKADKVARKTGLYSNNASTTALETSGEPSLAKVSSGSTAGEESSVPGKGKGVERISPANPGASSASNAPIQAELTPVIAEVIAEETTTEEPAGAEPSQPSNLRRVPSGSSSISSQVEHAQDERSTGHSSPDGTNASLEPMFNFRSLAAVIGDEEKNHEAEHVEDTAQSHPEGSSSATPSVHQPTNDSVVPEKTTPATNPEASPQGTSVLPKELETRSVEITNATTNTEATS